jgi:integrase
MTHLIKRAFDDHPWDFIVPLDCDEFIRMTNRSALENVLAGLDEASIGLSDIATYVPTENDDANEKDRRLPQAQGKARHRQARPPLPQPRLDVGGNRAKGVRKVLQQCAIETFREWCDAAGLPTRCKPHGLRKAACRRLAEARCSANEIMAISGHATMKEIVRYTAAADQARLARNALARSADTTARKRIA